MPADVTTARDDIYTTFHVKWDADTPAVNGGAVPEVFRDGIGEPTDKPTTAAWSRIQIRHAAGAQDGFGTGEIRTTKSGLVTVQIFQPLSTSPDTTLAEDLAKIAKSAYEGEVTANCVRFRDVTINEVGPTDAWYQINVVATFEYTEFA